MRKIPTLFERDWDHNPRRVVNKLAIDIEPIRDAIATAKWDGTGVALIDGNWYARHTLRRGKPEPLGWIPATEMDEKTGKQEGWKLITGNPEFQYHLEAISGITGIENQSYELVGPKIQGNPHGFEDHQLIPHGFHPLFRFPIDTPFDEMAEKLADIHFEGVVWWFGGEPVAKIKRTDFGLPWPMEEK
jgi:hypothetical protein